MKKRVLITGGNKGIGLELSREFLTLGYSIVVVARDFKDFELKDINNGSFAR
jgi:3-oxoacyl-[acyl-carrier protein] reductase